MKENAGGQSNHERYENLDIERLAALCSVGASPIPNDLPEGQQRKLIAAISKRRRERLIHLFASAIADDIWREQQVRGKDQC